MLLSANGDHIQMSNGARLTPGDAWTNSCSADLKNLNNRVDQAPILQQIKELAIYNWTDKSNPAEKHIGPTAEDFYAQFGLGESYKNISGVDLGGIALAAIKALATENELLKK